MCILGGMFLCSLYLEISFKQQILVGEAWWDHIFNWNFTMPIFLSILLDDILYPPLTQCTMCVSKSKLKNSISCHMQTSCQPMPFYITVSPFSLPWSYQLAHIPNQHPILMCGLGPTVVILAEKKNYFAVNIQHIKYTDFAFALWNLKTVLIEQLR